MGLNKQLEYFEYDGKYFRGKPDGIKLEILHGKTWEPYRGECTKVRTFGGLVTEDEVNEGMKESEPG